MKKSKNLNASIADLKAMQSGNDVTPEQKQAIEDVIGDIKLIRRKPNPKPHEFHRAIRTISEKLIRLFFIR